MVPRISQPGLIALWVITSTATATPETPLTTNPAGVPSTSPIFISPSQQPESGPSESVKIAISIAVTLSVILLGACISILCVVRRRNKELSNPQRRLSYADSFDEGDDGKSPRDLSISAARREQSPEESVYGKGLPALPGRVYTPQGQDPGRYAAGPAYPNQQNGHAGPSGIYPEQYQQQQYQPQQQQYQPQYQLQYQQPQQQPQPQPQPQQPQQYSQQPPPPPPKQRQPPIPEEPIPEEPIPEPIQEEPIQDLHFTYLADYHPPAQSTYYIPPHPHASELPEQRPVLELAGDGQHYYEVP